MAQTLDFGPPLSSRSFRIPQFTSAPIQTLEPLNHTVPTSDVFTPETTIVRESPHNAVTTRETPENLVRHGSPSGVVVRSVAPVVLRCERLRRLALITFGLYFPKDEEPPFKKTRLSPPIAR